ncbi:MAG: hypothetical protein ACE5FG_08395 [Myxococcota bacterium]
MELGVESESEKRERSEGQTTLSGDELEFSQFLHLDGAGYVYHPRFLSLLGAVDLELLQRQHDGDEILAGDDGSLLGGNLGLDFLPEHPYGLSLYGDRSERDVEREFSRSFELRTQLLGARFHYREGPLPLEISYDHRSREGSDLSLDIDETVDEFNVRGTYWIGERSRGKLTYTQTREDIGQQNLEIDRQLFSATNTTYLDPEKRKRFSGHLRYHDQSDVNDLSVTSALASLDWRHSNTLSAQYRGDIQRTEQNGDSVSNLNLSATLRHQLYESLSSTVDVYSRLEDASFGNTHAFGGIVDESYSKRLGAWGRLRLGLRPHAELEIRDPSQDTGFVVNEPVVLADSLPIELRRTDIAVGTLLVTDQSGAILYDENEDYRVTLRGALTEITRIPGGDITDGETVLVDYQHDLGGEADVLTTGVSTRARLELLDRLALYWRLTSWNQRETSGNGKLSLDSRDRQLTGIGFTRPWLSARVEYEDERGSFSSFRALSQAASVYTPPGSRWRARLSGSHRALDYTNTDEEVDRVVLVGTLQAAIGRRGLLRVEVEYERTRWSGQTDSELNDVDAIGVEASLLWSFRRVRAELGTRISRLDRLGQEESVDRVFLRVRREF